MDKQTFFVLKCHLHDGHSRDVSTVLLRRSHWTTPPNQGLCMLIGNCSTIHCSAMGWFPSQLWSSLEKQKYCTDLFWRQNVKQSSDHTTNTVTVYSIVILSIKSHSRSI